MPRSRAVEDSSGFTTTQFGRCCVCKEELKHGWAKCDKCAAIVIEVRLQPKQQQLLDYFMATGPDVPKILGYGGARAAGKSRGLRDIALILVSEMAQMYPGVPACIMRRNWTLCKSTHLAKLKLERPDLTQFYTDKEYEFPSAMGSPRIAFDYADTDDDAERIERGPEWFALLLDQGEQWSERNLRRFEQPNRWPGTAQGAAKMGVFFNPGGVGSQYLKRVFYDKTYHGGERESDFAFIQAYGFDNIVWFLNQGIEINGHPLTWEIFYNDLPGGCPELPANGKPDDKWLASIPNNHKFKIFVTQTDEGRKQWRKPESLRAGDLFGSFSNFEGQAFSGIWNRDRAVIR